MAEALRVAIVHDWLNQMGGAEQVLEALHQLYAEAPIYTSMYAPELMPEAYRSWKIHTSFMQRLPGVTRHHQAFLPLYPLAFESFDLSAYDLVISNSSAFCHGVLSRPDACHINYCLTPPRFLWNLPQYLERERVGRWARLFLPLLVHYLRLWDTQAAQRVDHFLGISQAVVARIGKYYRREATLLYPPVDTSRFQRCAEPEDYFLVVSRLIPYKRVDIAVQAFNSLGLPLLIVGDGRDRRALEAVARDNVRFLGRLPQDRVAELVARCRALIFPGEEDFGLVPLEAQAAGRPVIAYAAGGALETVIPGVSGELFSPQTPQALAEAIVHLDESSFDPQLLQRHAQRFDRSVFLSEFARFVEAKFGEGPAFGPLAPGREPSHHALT